MIRLRLTHITVIVTIAISLAGIIASGSMFHVWLERFKHEDQTRFETATTQKVTENFDATIDKIMAQVQRFSYNKAVRKAMQDGDRKKMANLLTEFNMAHLPIKANMLFISHGDEAEWGDVRKLFTLPFHDRIVKKALQLEPTMLFAHIPMPIENKPTKHLLLFSSPTKIKGSDPKNASSLRVIYDVSDQSDFVSKLIESAALDCISVHEASKPARVARCNGEKQEVDVSNLESKGYLASTVRFSRFPALSALQATIYRDVSSLNARWAGVHRSVIMTLFALLIISAISCAIWAHVFNSAVAKVVKYVSSESLEPQKPPMTWIKEFNNITTAYRSAQKKLAEQIEKKKQAEAKAMDLVSELDASQSQKMEALGTLTASVAHDFNNLLAVIRGHAETAQMMSKGSSNTTLLANSIISTVDRASGIVAQLLHYARPNKKNKTVFRMDETLEMLVGEIQNSNDKNIDIRFRNPEGLTSSVFMDIDQFKSIFLNLWLNAADAMPDGGTYTVTLRSAPKPEQPTTPDAQNFMCIEFADTGIGIEKETLSRIFEPFFTTKLLSGGSGLGLSIIYNFIKGVDGDIDVKSIPGQGTQFTIWLPICVADTKNPDVVERPLLPHSLSGRRILILEDEKTLSDIMKRMIELGGGKTNELYSLKDANEYLETQSSIAYDALVIDYQLGDGTGLQFYQEMVSRFGKVPTLVISGNLDYLDKEFQRQTPMMMSFLPKPFSCEEFIHKLQDTFQG